MLKPIRCVDGVWKIVTVEQAERLYESRIPEVDSEKEFLKKQRKREREQVNSVEKQCGTCKYIRYSGIQEVELRIGSCDKWKESGNLTVKNISDPCELWKFRGTIKMNSEKLKSESVVEKLRNTRMTRR